MLRLFVAMPAWLVSCLKNVFSCCCSNGLTAQSMGAQAVSPMLVRHMTIQRDRRYLELEDYGTMPPDPATSAGWIACRPGQSSAMLLMFSGETTCCFASNVN